MKKILTVSLLLILGFFAFAKGAKEQPLTLWHSFTGVKKTAIDKIVSNYNEKNKIKIDSIFQGSTTDLNTKLRAALQSNVGIPNMAILDASAIYDIIASDQLIPSSDLFKDDELNLLDQVIGSQIYKDKVLGTPFNASSILLYYNKDIFDELNLSAPRDFDELERVAKIIKEKKNIYALSNNFTTYEMVSMIGQQNGYSPITDNNNGHSGLATKTLILKDDLLKNIIDAYKKVYKTKALHLVKSSSSISEFLSSKTAMSIASSSKLTTLNAKAPFTLGVSYLPRINDRATGGVNVSGGAIYAFNSDLLDETKKAISFLVNEESQLIFHLETGYFPVNKGTYDSDEFKEKASDNLKVAVNQVLDSNPKLLSVWWKNSYPIYMDLQKEFEKAIINDEDSQSAANRIVLMIDNYLK